MNEPTIKILYFAWVQEQIGTDEEALTPPADIETIAGLVDWLKTQSDGHRNALSDVSRLRFAIDAEFADPHSPIAGAGEIAIFPPVTGGMR
ncbi:MAG: molybdopterin converting factor subunit 1 [Pseudomonadota bacterium]